jgi:hypothetical protein
MRDCEQQHRCGTNSTRTSEIQFALPGEERRLRLGVAGFRRNQSGAEAGIHHYWRLTESSRVGFSLLVVSASTKRELDSGQLVVLAVRWRLQIWIKAAITYMQLQPCLVGSVLSEPVRVTSETRRKTLHATCSPSNGLQPSVWVMVQHVLLVCYVGKHLHG